ncbi:MAG TPA: hypothetical protein PKK95_00725 [Vicinamibacterales bacterium]|nr:hypothetical protein [Vicinamibacterales bacterium]
MFIWLPGARPPSTRKSTSRVSAPGIPNSIQRCSSLNGWSVRTRNPSFSV